VRLPLVSEADVLGRTLLAEGRRTIIAAQNQLGGRRVEEVILFGDGEHHAALKQLLEKELSLTVRLVDPFEHVEWGDARSKKPEYPGTFAPLLGMLLDESASRAPVIDFLHARKKKPPPDNRRKYLIAAAAVAAALVIGFGGIEFQLWSYDSRIRELTADRGKQEKAAKASVRPKEDAKLLESFAAGDITWLDEMARTSQKFPPAEAARVYDLKAQVNSKEGGSLTLDGYADNIETIKKLEIALRDKQHSVKPKGSNQDPKLEGLQWWFEEHVNIGPPLTAAAPPNAKAAEASANAPAAASAAKQGGGQ